MNIYKQFLLSAKKKKRIFIGYFAFFLVITFITSNSLNTVKNELKVEYPKAKIALIDKSSNVEFSEHFKDFIAPHSILYSDGNYTEENLDELKDLTISGIIDALIIIDSEPKKKLLEGRAPISIYFQNRNITANVLNENINSYLQFLKASSSDEIVGYEKALHALSQSAEIIIASPETINFEKIWFYNYLKFLSFPISSILLSIILIVLRESKSSALHARIAVSPITPRQYFTSRFLGSLTVAILVISIFFLAGLPFIGWQINLSDFSRWTVNLLSFTVSLLALILMIDSIGIKKQNIGGMANIYSLGTSFLCGVFIPMEFLPKTVTNISRLFPVYYYVKGLHHENNIYLYIGIQLLFALAFSITGIFIRRSGQQVKQLKADESI